MTDLKELEKQYQKLGEEIERLKAKPKFQKGDWVKDNNGGWYVFDKDDSDMAGLKWAKIVGRIRYGTNFSQASIVKHCSVDPKSGDLVYNPGENSEQWVTICGRLTLRERGYKMLIPKEYIDELMENAKA